MPLDIPRDPEVQPSWQHRLQEDAVRRRPVAELGKVGGFLIHQPILLSRARPPLFQE